jgi:hypothetical protein
MVKFTRTTYSLTSDQLALFSDGEQFRVGTKRSSIDDDIIVSEEVAWFIACTSLMPISAAATWRLNIIADKMEEKCAFTSSAPFVPIDGSC